MSYAQTCRYSFSIRLKVNRRSSYDIFDVLLIANCLKTLTTQSCLAIKIANSPTIVE